ncbi:MAG: FMN-binding protein [Spirochaetales bacterium]|nr:FMN-binding protein [Spirochaetales bacterium]
MKVTKEKKGMKEELQMSVFLLVMATLCTLLLAFGNSLYQKALAEREKELRMDILRTFQVPFTEETFFSDFNNAVEIEKDKRTTYYFSRGESRQVAIITAGSGLWSEIDIFLVVDIGAMEIQELRVLSHGETPGLGGRIEEDWFLDQFIDLDISDGVKIVMERTNVPGEVDAISGATRTSNAVMIMLNKALDGVASMSQ